MNKILALLIFGLLIAASIPLLWGLKVEDEISRSDEARKNILRRICSEAIYDRPSIAVTKLQAAGLPIREVEKQDIIALDQYNREEEARVRVNMIIDEFCVQP
jgi:hypothetical protein